MNILYLAGAAKKMVDSANQYQLFVNLDPNFRFPFGVQERYVNDTKVGNAVQQPFEPFEPPSFGDDIPIHND